MKRTALHHAPPPPGRAKPRLHGPGSLPLPLQNAAWSRPAWPFWGARTDVRGGSARESRYTHIPSDDDDDDAAPPPRPIDTRVHTNTNTMMLCCSRLRLTTPCFTRTHTHRETQQREGRRTEDSGRSKQQAAGRAILLANAAAAAAAICSSWIGSTMCWPRSVSKCGWCVGGIR